MNEVPTRPLTILTYNTHLFLGTPGPEYQDEMRMSGIIEKLRGCGSDVVGLCEVWADASKLIFVEALQREFPFSYFEPNDNLPKLGSGLLILSKHRIVQTKFIAFEHLVGTDALSTKGALIARLAIQTDGSAFNVFVVLSHTQAGHRPNETTARWSNLLQIWNAIRQEPYGRSPLYLIGDLNFNAEADGQPTDEYARVVRQFDVLRLYDIFRLVHPDVVATPGFTSDWNTNLLKRVFDPDDRSALRLDYVFGINVGTGSGSSADVLLDYRYNDQQSGGRMDLSDHYPVKTVSSS